VETNLVWFDVDPELGTARDVQQLLQQHGVLVSSTGPQVCRACTHLDVSTAQVEQAAEAIRKALRSPIATKRKSSPAHASMPGSD
jgi:threonine aldolase